MIVFDNEQLVPIEWRHLLAGGPVRVFNPGLLRHRGGWILAYRVVFETDGLRRIALCHLREDFEFSANSAVPYSEMIRFEAPDRFPGQALTWFADPRLYHLGSKTYLYWNSGWHEPRNCQFLQEFDPDTLKPLGQPRELTLTGSRQKLEKNWALFEADGAVFAVYSVNPHRILKVKMTGEDAIVCDDVGPTVPNAAGFAQLHGGLRGGAPPQRCVDRFTSFCHAIENSRDGYSYVAAAYQFRSVPPFSPVAMPRRPLTLRVPDEARRQHAKLNPAVGHVVYPGGAARQDRGWALSIGIDDERCAIAFVTDEQLTDTLESIDDR
jgi:hypothetical protein